MIVSIMKRPEVWRQQEGFGQNAFVNNVKKEATAKTKVKNKYCTDILLFLYGPLWPINPSIVLLLTLTFVIWSKMFCHVLRETLLASIRWPDLSHLEALHLYSIIAGCCHSSTLAMMCCDGSITLGDRASDTCGDIENGWWNLTGPNLCLCL